jgi:hypothetical protein
MLEERPEGWLTYLKKYVKANMIVTDLLKQGSLISQMIQSVRLKNLNCLREINYYIQLGQHLTELKFESPQHKEAYKKIKALKTVLKIDFNNYLLKKLLLRQVQFDSDEPADLLYDILNQPELKIFFELRIDFEKWSYKNKRRIPLKKMEEQ